MNCLARFRAALNFEPVDRLPVFEYAPWWDKTLDRWRSEGLPELAAYHDYFGLDRSFWFSFPVKKKIIPLPTVRNEAEYDAVREYLFPEVEENVAVPVLREHAAASRRGDIIVPAVFQGFFWFPRTLFGIEQHLFAFYDNPRLMHRMNEDLLRYNRKLIEKVRDIYEPAFVCFNEDLSYNHGPMLSKDAFDEFIAPYYREITPLIHKHGLLAMVDTDGFMEGTIPWFESVGVDGSGPIERQARNDVCRMRRNHPKWRMYGGFDKTVMHKGEEAMRREFEFLLPAMRSGGYIPCVDHQTPPEVSLNDYRLYMRLLMEYSRRAVE